MFSRGDPRAASRGPRSGRRTSRTTREAYPGRGARARAAARRRPRPGATRRPEDLRGRRGRRHPPGEPGRRSRTLAGPVPELFGGAADLSESNMTDVKGAADFAADEAGRNLRFGVREHAMGGIANGIAYHGGFIPTPARSSSSATTCAGPFGSRRWPGSTYLRLDPRLGRPGRGRPDPPAGRALRRASRDPQPVVHPARRRERDVGGLAVALGAAGRPGRPGAHPPEAGDAARDRREGRRRCRARRLRRRESTAAAESHRADPPRDRVRAAAGRRGRRRARRRGHPGPGGVAAVLGAVRAPAEPPTATRSCRRRPQRRRASRPASRSAGSASRRRGRDRRDRPLRRERPGATIFKHFGFTPERVAEVPGGLRDAVRGGVPTVYPGHQPRASTSTARSSATERRRAAT